MTKRLGSLNSKSVLMLILVMVSIIAVVFAEQQQVYATGAARDYDERYEDIPGANECWFDGYSDGENDRFNHDKDDACQDKGNQYYRAFIYGCMSVEGNTKDACESATDV